MYVVLEINYKSHIELKLIKPNFVCVCVCVCVYVCVCVCVCMHAHTCAHKHTGL